MTEQDTDGPGRRSPAAEAVRSTASSTAPDPARSAMSPAAFADKQAIEAEIAAANAPLMLSGPEIIALMTQFTSAVRDWERENGRTMELEDMMASAADGVKMACEEQLRQSQALAEKLGIDDDQPSGLILPDGEIYVPGRE